MSKFVIIALFATISSTWAYSAGAPESTCEDMTPKHPVDPQRSKFPYKIQVSKNQIPPGGEIEITITSKSFKGFVLQVRDKNNKSVGQWQIPDDDKYAKAINCFGTKASAATHKNATDKKNFTLKWKAPASPGKYTVYATVAQDGGTFWVRKPTEVIAVE
ncbi:hypothetical protein NQ317_000339 [Molorchus minor]|uniref:Reelin domain-containing protein n=1 Tax=Molorchus minor TaxID=1323400 RepID=A0ABQ9K0B8_9CUCU|nr:hypothetical protein NQ317_000339 [Molorchus minor]